MANRIGFWLCTRDVSHDRVDLVTFKLKQCPFNPAHVDKFMIRVQSRGGIWAGCWHDSCGGNINRWASVKDKIGGWGQEGTQFTRGDDIELARRLLGDLAGAASEAPVGDLGRLWRFENITGLWRAFDEEELYQSVSCYAGQRAGKRTIRLAHGQIHGVMSAAKMLAGRAGFFGEAPPGVAFTNGVLTATPAGTAFVPHDPDNRLNVGLPYAYNTEATCPRWRTYLADVFENDEDGAQKIDALQEFLGACLVGIAPRFQRALLLYGMSGDNGKSVFTAVASALFPDEVRRAVKPQDWGKEYYAAALAGARLNVVSEVPETDILSGDTFKAMISGDRISGRFTHHNVFDFQPVAGHIFACNRLPGTSDHTNGFWKRFIIIEYTRSFPAGHPLRDNLLADKIISSEMPGIAAWAVAGASRLLAQSAFTIPQSHERLMRTWKTDVDSVAAFLEECCDVSGDERTPIRELYPYFKYFCQLAGRKPIADSTFARRLRENKVGSVSGDSYKLYGVIIRESVKRQWEDMGFIIGLP
jgi:P4 family phage/plasmid primase-like protien